MPADEGKSNAEATTSDRLGKCNPTCNPSFDAADKHSQSE